MQLKDANGNNLTASSGTVTFAAPTSALACRPMPFDLHVAMATRALQTKKLEPGKRQEAERLLTTARDGKGPRWHGERQQALNKALVILSMPEASRAPLEELSPREQEEQRRDDAKDTLASIDDLLPKRTLSDADLAKVKQIRDEHDWERYCPNAATLSALAALPWFGNTRTKATS